MDDNTFLHKHELHDGTVVFTTHPTISSLHRVLKTTKKVNRNLKLSHKISSKSTNFPQPPPHIKKMSEPIIKPFLDQNEFTLVQNKFSHKKPFTPIAQNHTNLSPNNDYK